MEEESKKAKGEEKKARRRAKKEEDRKKQRDAERMVSILIEMADENGIACAQTKDGYTLVMTKECLEDMIEHMDHDDLDRIITHVDHDKRDARGDKIPDRKEMH